MGRSVLITGCNGYLGVEMSMYFRMHGWRVFGVDVKPAPDCQSDVLHDFENKHVQDLAAAPWVVDAVIHLAGASKITDELPDSRYHAHNVESTKHLRALYPTQPLYLASTIAMYNEQKQIEHKHAYSRTKHEAEAFADVIFRMGTVCGVNRAGYFDYIIDLMIDSAIKDQEIVVAQGAKMRSLAGITYICMMYFRNVENGALAKRARKDNAKVIMHLYETCQSIENIGVATHRGLSALSQTRYGADKINLVLQNDLNGIAKQAPAISSVPPDFQPGPIYDVRLMRLVMECVERYEYFARKEGKVAENTH